MAREFPHLNDTQFPDVGSVDVYRYANEFDYERYDFAQMEVTLCAVPWDMGEAHVGNRTISGIGNVVYFGSKANRDAWFDAIPDDKCHRFTTKFKELHRSNEITVPLPFDVAGRFNYVAVRYHLFANDGSPVEFEQTGGVDWWGWFIREVEFVSPNTTRLHLLNDAWQTFIYDVEISSMILERGHAPMFATDADTYLANPIANCANLLAEDVNFGSTDVVKSSVAKLFNPNDDTVRAVIISDVSPISDMGVYDNTSIITTGTQNGTTAMLPPLHISNYRQQDTPNKWVFCTVKSQLSSLLNAIATNAPQFMRTIRGICFISSNLFELGAQITVQGVTCNWVGQGSYVISDYLELNKAMFQYESAYQDIAKLYTYPYAEIAIYDEKGNESRIRIENINSKLQIASTASMVFPWLAIDAHILGYGKSANVYTFANLTGRAFPASGNWHELLNRWSIPVFGVIQSSRQKWNIENAYAKQAREHDAYTAFNISSRSNTARYDDAMATAAAVLANANDSADTVETNANRLATADKNNAYARADTDHQNSYNNANTTKQNEYNNATLAYNNAEATALCENANNGYQRVANTALTTASNTRINSDSFNTQTYNQFATTAANYYIANTTNNQVARDQAQAGVSAASSIATGATGAALSLATGNIGGAVASAVGGIVGAGANMANAGISVNFTQSQATEQQTYNNQKYTLANTDTANKATYATTFNDAQLLAQNTAMQNSATNTYNTMHANALRVQSTGTTNADNTESLIKTNADNTQTMVKANADRTLAALTANSALTKTTAKGNATRTYNTASSNNYRDYQTETTNIDDTRAKTVFNIRMDGNQAALEPPTEFGEWENGEYAVTRPMGLFADIVTQDDYAISRAGDEFLRYGYAYGKQWAFDGNWNIGDKFTYWKLTDFWVKGLNVPDLYMDKLRFFLFGGVTVWNDPADIGNTSIYENWPS